jgi:hypothetical protein
VTQITISDGVTTITMPKVRKVSVGGAEVAKEVTMASGKMVKDVIGHRTVVEAEWDYVPASTIATLHSLLRQGGYFSVGYPDPDGTYKSGSFSVSYPTSKIFKFKNGVAMWHSVSLTMTAQEVE